MRQYARELYVQLQASEKIKTALSKNLRKGSKAKIEVNDTVYYYREHPTSKALTGWQGPAYFLGITRGACMIRHGARTLTCAPNWIRPASVGSPVDTETDLKAREIVNELEIVTPGEPVTVKLDEFSLMPKKAITFCRRIMLHKRGANSSSRQKRKKKYKRHPNKCQCHGNQNP